MAQSYKLPCKQHQLYAETATPSAIYTCHTRTFTAQFAVIMAVDSPTFHTEEH